MGCVPISLKYNCLQFLVFTLNGFDAVNFKGLISLIAWHLPIKMPGIQIMLILFTGK